MNWRIAPGQALRRHSWQDETVIYNDLSGATHLIGAAANAVLDALRDDPASLAGEASAALDEILEELAALALIEPAP
ncbi:MAG: hypothetical protein ACLGI6_12860 [Gammaproteobacteria bacterium]